MPLSEGLKIYDAGKYVRHKFYIIIQYHYFNKLLPFAVPVSELQYCI
jgi:hypothetical protein